MGAEFGSPLVARAANQQLGETILHVEQRRSRSWRLRFIAMWLVIVAGLVAFVALTVRLDADFINGWAPFILAGVPVTLFISAVSIAFAIVLATLGALGRLSRNAFINGAASFYVSFFRGTPLILQILFLFLALPQAGIVLDPLPTAILALGMNYGAYMTEIFRAGILAVPTGRSRRRSRWHGRPDHVHPGRPAQAFRIVIRPSATTSSRCSRTRRSPTRGRQGSCGARRRRAGRPSVDADPAGRGARVLYDDPVLRLQNKLEGRCPSAIARGPSRDGAVTPRRARAPRRRCPGPRPSGDPIVRATAIGVLRPQPRAGAAR